jgi:rhodanese-related sulfurtransferase
MNLPGIQVEELKQRLDAGDNLFLLDVRDEYEYEISNIGGHLIPLAELPKRMHELDASQEIIALCKMGPRGDKAVEVLRKAGFDKVRNLTGGIRAWSDRVDPKIRKY